LKGDSVKSALKKAAIGTLKSTGRATLSSMAEGEKPRPLVIKQRPPPRRAHFNIRRPPGHYVSKRPLDILFYIQDDDATWIV